MGHTARAVLNHGVSPHTSSYYDDRISTKFLSPAESNTQMAGESSLSALHALLRRAYPNGKTEKSVGPARDVASQPKSKCSHIFCSPHISSLLHFRPRLAERYNLPFLFAPPPSSLPESACSHSFCLPHAFSPRTTPFSCLSEGGGLCPHVYPWPLTFPYIPRALSSTSRTVMSAGETPEMRAA